MTENRNIRINKVLRELNISLATAVNFLESKKIKIESSPNSKISELEYEMLCNNFSNTKKSTQSKAINIPSKINHKDISISSKIDLFQHRKFTIKDQKERSTIIEDCITKITYPYKKISLFIDDEVILYVNSIDNTGKPILKYSILNDFILGNNYDFDVTEKRANGYVIENSENYTSFIPLRYEKNIIKNKINLEIENFDLAKNSLIFKDSDIKEKKEDYVAVNYNEYFEENGKYNFNVTGYRILENNSSIITLNYEGIYATVKAFDFQNQDNLPENIKCIVTKIIDNKLYLIQDKIDLYQNIYTENNEYDFEVIELDFDPFNNSKYYIVSDKYNFKHKLYYNEFESDEFNKIEIGTKIKLVVRKITEKGHLVLNLNLYPGQGTFFTVEKIFDDINNSEFIEKYFYSFRNLISDEEFENQPFKNLHEDYENRENLWVFSYLSMLDFFIQKRISENEINEAYELNKIYILVEEWLLEGSNFLKRFNIEKRQNIILKAEHQFKKATARGKALKLIIEHKSEDYIKNVLDTLRISSYLRDEKIEIFKYLTFSSIESVNKKTNEIIEITLLLIKGDLLDSYDVNNFIGLLQKRINIEKFDLNPDFIQNRNKNIDSETKNALENIIKVTLLQIYLFNKNLNKSYAVTKTANLFRYTSLLESNESDKKRLLEYAIFCITNNILIEVDLGLIDNFKSSKILDLVKISNNTKIDKNIIGNQIFKYNGSVFSFENGWSLISKRQLFNHAKTKGLNLYNLISYFNNNIVVSSTNNINLDLNCNSKISDCNENWNKYYSGNFNSQDKFSAFSDDIKVGRKYNVFAKNYLKGNNNVVFVQIIDKGIEAEGIIHIKDATKAFIDGLDEVINPGDELIAEINNKDNNKITFSINNDCWIKTKEEASVNTIVDAKIIDIVDDKNVFLITENGHFGYYYNANNINIEKRKIYKFKIKSLDDNQATLNLDYLTNSARNFNDKKVYRDFLLRNGIIKTNDVVEKDFDEDSLNILLLELISCVESYIILEIDNFKKIELFQLLRLLTSIIKSPKSYFFDAIINYFLNVEKFKNTDFNNEELFFEYIDEQTTSLFKNLDNINETYKILNFVNKPDSTSTLIELINTVDNEETKKLVNLILAHNLLFENDNNEIILRRTKDLIYEYLSKEKVNTFDQIFTTLNEEKDDHVSQHNSKTSSIPTNLGRESTSKEFKTSYVYYAGNNKADLVKQPFVIMKTIAGFLNSKGGSLFIGVNDKGEICGLKNDYDFFGVNTNNDKYEREIRSNIVNSFNKDVNAQIEFKFSHYNDLEYCEIIIPEYEKPISLQENFYQRQGNETRILTGSDLVVFIERKVTKSNQNMLGQNFIVNKINKVESSQIVVEHNKNVNNQNKDILLEEENIDFYSDIREENNELTKQSIKNSNYTIAYLYIFINGKYLLSRSKLSNLENYELLEIKSNHKHGYLLQCYDNGCVNKVEVRTILNKTFGKFYSNAFSDHGNLIGLYIIENDCLIQINTKRYNNSFIKIFETSNISTHSLLNLKGNNLVQIDFDMLEKFSILENTHRNKIERLIYASKQSIGVNVINKSYSNEIEYLSKLNIVGTSDQF